LLVYSTMVLDSWAFRCEAGMSTFSRIDCKYNQSSQHNFNE
jgi:hypothetical protein